MKNDPNIFIFVEEDNSGYFGAPPTKLENPKPVSYTHLDVYKRQIPTGEVKEAIKEPQLQKQVTGQMKIEEILASWEEKQKRCV